MPVPKKISLDQIQRSSEIKNVLSAFGDGNIAAGKIKTAIVKTPADGETPAVYYTVQELLDAITSTISEQKKNTLVEITGKNAVTTINLPNNVTLTDAGVVVNINGISYTEGQYFTVNRSTNVITWTDTDITINEDLADYLVVEYFVAVNFLQAITALENYYSKQDLEAGVQAIKVVDTLTIPGGASIEFVTDSE